MTSCEVQLAEAKERISNLEAENQLLREMQPATSCKDQKGGYCRTETDIECPHRAESDDGRGPVACLKAVAN